MPKLRIHQKGAADWSQEGERSERVGYGCGVWELSCDVGGAADDNGVRENEEWW